MRKIYVSFVKRVPDYLGGPKFNHQIIEIPENFGIGDYGSLIPYIEKELCEKFQIGSTNFLDILSIFEY